MSWVTPILSATGDLITSALYAINYYNLRYLKGLDGPISLDNMINFHSSQGFDLPCLAGWTTRELDTPYQNTSSTIRLVLVRVFFHVGDEVIGTIGPNTPPNFEICRMKFDASSGYFTGTMLLVVPTGWYYMIKTLFGTPSLSSSQWYEFWLGRGS